jgi:peptidoglycan hydrolase-like protein with peptidoglycan-binding domain
MSEPNSTITIGDKDSAIVKQIQTRLNQKGFGPLTEDGDFGTKTLQAVKLFQQSHLDKYGNPLIVDGKVGPLTRASLFDEIITQDITSPPLLIEVLKVARKEIGVKEVPPGSNRGPTVNVFQKGFRKYKLRQSGVKDSFMSESLAKNKWFKNHNTVCNPKPGSYQTR